MRRVIAKSSLKKFWERSGCADARGPLHSWYEEALKAVAKITEADYFKAGSAEDLKKVYQHLSTQFTLEKRDTEITALLAGAALLLIAMAIGLSALWFRIGPQKTMGPLKA